MMMLESGPDAYNEAKLQEELQKVADEYHQEQERRSAEQPQILADERNIANSLMDKRAELKAKIRFMAADPQARAERKALAFEILDITMRLDDIYNTKEFYLEHGYLPSGKLEVGDDPVKLKARQLTVRTYVTKYTQSGNKVKLLKYSEELAIIDKKLESFT